MKKNRSVLLVPADKAGKNIVSVCNINCILDELGFHSASGNQKSFFSIKMDLVNYIILSLVIYKTFLLQTIRFAYRRIKKVLSFLIDIIYIVVFF